MTPEESFAQLLRAGGGPPFVTYYDEGTGERTELSRASCANWVAKTHHLLTDELGLGPGSRAVIALPAHWITVPVLLGCLSAGLELDSTGAADVAFVSAATAGRATGILDVFAVDPAQAALGFPGGAPAGSTDFVTAVRPQADAWAGVSRPAGDGDPCLPGLSRAAAMQRASDHAGELSLGAGGRLLSTRDWSGPGDWLDTLFTILAVGGSLVLLRRAPDETVVARRAEQERATALLN